MKKPEASTTVSHTQTDVVANAQRDLLVSGKANYIDAIFPLYDFMFKFVNVPAFISYFASIIQFAQALSVCLWFRSLLKPDLTKYYGVIERYIALCLFVFDIDPSNSESFSYYFLYTCGGITGITVIGIIVSVAYFRAKRRFDKWMVIALRFLFEDVCMLMLFPIALFASYQLVLCFGGVTATRIASLIFGVALYLINYFIYKVSYDLASFSADIPRSPTAAVASEMYSSASSAVSLVIFLQEFSSLFNKWFQFAVAVLSAVFAVFMTFVTFKEMPFIHIMTKVGFPSICITCTVMNIYASINFLTGFTKEYTFFLPYAVFIISAVSISFWLKNFEDKRKANLSYSNVRAFHNKEENDAISDQEKVQYLESLGLGSSEDLMKIYFRVGLYNASDLFIDWSLVRFCLSHYDTTQMISSALQYVSFFPSEIRQLNSIFSVLSKRFDLSFKERFLLYQIYRVKVVRQSSSSSEMAGILGDMREVNSQVNDKSAFFWTSAPEGISFFWDYSNIVNKSRSYWEEAIREHPNSPLFSEAYTSFLIDGATDFEAAVIETRRRNLIEAGRSFSVDSSFLSLAWSLPIYIRKGFLDASGNFKKQNGKSGDYADSGPNGTGGSNGSVISSEFEIDQELEDSISRSIITQPKMRLALQRALQGRESQYSNYIKIYGFIGFALAITVLFVFYYIFSTFFDDIKEIMTEQINNARWRLYLALGRLTMDQYWAASLGLFNKLPIMAQNAAIDGPIAKGFDPGGNMPNQIQGFTVLARSFISGYLKIVGEDAVAGVPVFTTAQPYVKTVIPFVYCDGANVLNKTVNMSAKGASAYLALLQSQMAEIPPSQYDNSSLLCEITNNIMAIEDNTDQYYDLVLKYESDWSAQQVTSAYTYAAYVPICLWLVCSVPSIIFFALAVRELASIRNAMVGIEEKSKQSAVRTVQKMIDSENTRTAEAYHWTSSLIEWSFAGLAISYIFVPIILVILFVYAADSAKTFKKLSSWTTFGVPRTMDLMEASEHLYFALVLISNHSVSFTTRTSQAEYANKSMSKLIASQVKLLSGYGDIPACSGYDSVIDNLMNQQLCTPNENVTTAHERYRCASLNQVLDYSNTYLQSTLARLDLNIDPRDMTFYDFLHISNTHMLTRTMEMEDRLSSLASVEISSFNQILGWCTGIGVVLLIGSLFFLLQISWSYDGAFSAALALMRKVPPSAIINNTELENFLLSASNRNHSNEMSLGQRIIHFSESAIICLGRNQVIEVVNPAVTKLLGYTPEQLLGQAFSTLIKDDQKEPASHQLALMKARQSSDLYEGRVIFVTDDNREVPCSVNFLGMMNALKEITSFVIILRDETALMQQQQAAECAKKNNESLLYQILPRDIVVKLNDGDKDISFTVPSSTIMFIDIVKFSEYAFNLTPQQIMGNISLIFNAFDSIIAKYPLITKIKLIGDIYMCAAGLFNPDAPPQAHAEQMTRFALDCLAELDEINVKLDSNLSVRIGVNTGGPVIAGVLGKDKPVFDIIGDPINVAARLQSTCVPGKIQIPDSTYGLIRDLKFNIEPRGEIFLKGKGKAQTYIISPAGFLVSAHSSEAKPIL